MVTTDPVLREIVRRLVAVARPERVILFGSAARGKVGPDSDYDFLVVKRGRYRKVKLLGDLHMALCGSGVPVDIVLATPGEVRRYRNAHCLVIQPALKEGREVYRA